LWLRTTVAITRLMGSKPFGALFEVARADGYKMLEADCRSETLFDYVSALTADSVAA
jgi:hypothetical protein